MNSAPQTIADLSSLTRVQVETLKIRRSLLKAEINMDTALKIRKNSGISRGTYYRILAQARKNLTESLFTVAVGVQMGLLKADEVQKLVAAVSKIPAEVDQEKLPEVIALVTALADRIVTL